MATHNTADNGFKLIFGNHQLFSDFLRDFIHIDILKDVKPEDIEDISERFLPLFQENRDSDTVKRINLKDTLVFVIAILEHESEVNHRSSFKMLQYICLVLDSWEKEAEKENPGVSKRKEFKYPPVLPIVFYDGKNKWTAERNFFNRTHPNTVFEKYIPKFEYELVNLNDYSEKEIQGFGDALSLIMLIDKLRDSGGERLLKHLPEDYLEKLNLQIPPGMGKLLSDVIRVFLDKSNVDRYEAESFVANIGKTDLKGYKGMFEAAIESIKEGREEARKEGIVQGIEQGLEQGLEKGIVLTARNALAKGLPMELIHDITGLDVETIKSLQAGA
jgi:predicted transposase/invertase (TIGR01784 family)